MSKGQRVQYACGHWWVSSEFGLQESYAQEMARKICGDCQRRLKDAAPQLLAALEEIIEARDAYHGGDLARAIDRARPIVKSAVGDRDPIE